MGSATQMLQQESPEVPQVAPAFLPASDELNRRYTERTTTDSVVSYYSTVTDLARLRG